MNKKTKQNIITVNLDSKTLKHLTVLAEQLCTNKSSVVRYAIEQLAKKKGIFEL